MALWVLGIGCAVALGCLLVARRARTSATAGWACTNGTVISSTVQVGNRSGARHEAPLVLYSYVVDGSEYQGDRVRLTGTSGEAAAVVGRYPAGACVQVYYDPARPSTAVLEP